jgi:YVTN family beta-propeller protein
MRKYFCGLAYLWFLAAMPVAASTTLIYVSNQDGSSVSVIDPATNKVVQRIDGIAQPDGITFSPDGTRAYIPDAADPVLNVIDTKTGQIIKKVTLSGLPNIPAMTHDGKRLLVAIAHLESKSDASIRGGVDIIDTTSLERIKTIPMKVSLHDMFITPDGKYAIAGSVSSHVISVVDLQTEQVIWDLPFDGHGLRPSKSSGDVLTFAIEGGPDRSTSRVFVELGGLNGFAVVDFATHKEVARVDLPEPVYGYLDQPTHGSGIAPDGKTLWVCSRGSDTVFIYSLPEVSLLGEIHMPEVENPGFQGRSGDPHWLTFTPDSKTAYITLAALKSVSAVDVKSMKEVARIPVGENPRHIAAVVLPGSFVSTQDLNAPVAAPPRPLAARWVAQLPDGKPKGIITAKCQLCHNLQRVVVSHRSKDEWKDLVDTMIQRGSPVSPDEAAIIVDYLSKNFGPLSANPSAVTSGTKQDALGGSDSK